MLQQLEPPASMTKWMLSAACSPGPHLLCSASRRMAGPSQTALMPLADPPLLPPHLLPPHLLCSASGMG